MDRVSSPEGGCFIRDDGPAAGRVAQWAVKAFRPGRPVRDALLLEFFRESVLVTGVCLGTLFLVTPDVSPARAAGHLVICAGLALYGSIRVARAARRPFPAAVRGFRTVTRPTVVVHHDPAVEPLDAVVIALLCERELPLLEKAFGVRLRYWRTRRPRVYVFPSAESVEALYRQPFTGFAEAGIGAVILSGADCNPELVRHELAHLLAHKAYGAWPVKVVTEGLAVWAERTYGGSAVHDVAAAIAGRSRKPPAELLPPHWGDASARRLWELYAAAGSFTGYLIGRFGWPAYRRFYRGMMGTERAFRRRFRRRFGLTFEAARDDWLTKLGNGELTGRPGRDSFDPE